MPPTPEFWVGNTNMLVSKMWKFAFPDAKSLTPNLEFVLAPTPNPDASQWNIGGVGCQRKIFASSMYISCFLCRFHLRRAPNANPFFLWNMGLSVLIPSVLVKPPPNYKRGTIEGGVGIPEPTNPHQVFISSKPPCCI